MKTDESMCVVCARRDNCSQLVGYGGPNQLWGTPLRDGDGADVVYRPTWADGCSGYAEDILDLADDVQ